MPAEGCALFCFRVRARYRMLILSAFCMACAAFAAGPAAAQSVAASSTTQVDTSSTTRLESVMAVIRARDPLAGPGLAARFDAESQPAIRAWIVRGVAALGAPRGERFFRRALRDPSALVRLAAVEASAKSAGAQAVPELSAALAAETNAGVRHGIMAALGAIDTPESAAALQSAQTGDRDANVRAQAAQGLRQHRERKRRSGEGRRR